MTTQALLLLKILVQYIYWCQDQLHLLIQVLLLTKKHQCSVQLYLYTIICAYLLFCYTYEAKAQQRENKNDNVFLFISSLPGCLFFSDVLHNKILREETVLSIFVLIKIYIFYLNTTTKKETVVDGCTSLSHKPLSIYLYSNQKLMLYYYAPFTTAKFLKNEDLVCPLSGIDPQFK